MTNTTIATNTSCTVNTTDTTNDANATLRTADGGTLTAWLARRVRRCRVAAEAGMSTAEYAVGTVAACGFAAVLYKIVTSGPVRSALTGVIEKALHAPF
jgi:hypothetical protein